MEVLHIIPTRDTPEVMLDKRNALLKITGNSYPSNSVEFYEPILEWFHARFAEGTVDNVVLELYFHYINTSSTKIIIKFLEMLEEYHNQGHKVHVTWFYDQDDTNMYEIGEDIRNFVSIPFELVMND